MEYFIKQTVFDDDGSVIYQDEEPSHLLTEGYFDTDRYYEGGKILSRFKMNDGNVFDGELLVKKIIDKKCYKDDCFIIIFEAKIS